MEHLEWRWLIGNGVATAAISIALFVYGMSRDDGPPAEIPGALLASLVVGFFLSLLFAVIPSRIAINLAPSRRGRFRIETVVLLITFVALGLMLASLIVFRENG